MSGIKWLTNKVSFIVLCLSINKYVLPLTIVSFKIEVIFISVADSVHCGFTVVIALVIVMSA